MLKLIKKEKLKEKYKRYDIEVDNTHNFVASGVIVHNSNMRFGLVAEDSNDGRVLTYMAGSHGVRRKELDIKGNISVFWVPLQRDNVKCMLANLVRQNPDCYSVIVFAERFGNVQDLKYGIPNTTDFRVFDIVINGNYLNWDKVVEICDMYQVKIVPELYRGPFSHKVIEEYTDGNTLVADIKQIREGVVFKPLTERYSDVLGGRTILKSVSVSYLSRKNATDNA